MMQEMKDYFRNASTALGGMAAATIITACGAAGNMHEANAPGQQAQDAHEHAVDMQRQPSPKAWWEEAPEGMQPVAWLAPSKAPWEGLDPALRGAVDELESRLLGSSPRGGADAHDQHCNTLAAQALLHRTQGHVERMKAGDASRDQVIPPPSHQAYTGVRYNQPYGYYGPPPGVVAHNEEKTATRAGEQHEAEAQATTAAGSAAGCTNMPIRGQTVARASNEAADAYAVTTKAFNDWKKDGKFATTFGIESFNSSDLDAFHQALDAIAQGNYSAAKIAIVGGDDSPGRRIGKVEHFKDIGHKLQPGSGEYVYRAEAVEYDNALKRGQNMNPNHARLDHQKPHGRGR